MYSVLKSILALKSTLMIWHVHFFFSLAAAAFRAASSSFCFCLKATSCFQREEREREIRNCQARLAT